MATKTRTIVNAVCLTSGRGHTVFNDKLTNGERSVKVWGWTGADYAEAASMLREAGCTVKIVHGENTRLHVTEQ